MRTLSRSARRKTPAGLPIPDVFPELARLGVRPRRGEVTLIAAESNAGKTFMGMYWAAATRLRTLYFSADSDARTMQERAAAMVSGETQELVREDFGKYAEYLDELDYLRWVFESDPSYVDLIEETTAYAEAYGDFPEVIVVDNLANVAGEQEDEYRSMRDTTKALHRLSRISQAAVIVLHHVREEGPEHETHPPSKRKLKGKLGDFPELILTLRHDQERNVMQVAPVKGRHCKADRSGKLYAEVWFNPDRARFYNSKFDFINNIAA